MTKSETASNGLSPEEKLYSAIGYLGILCVVPLVLKRKSAFCQHHGRQGLVVLVAWVILWIGNIIPILGQIVWMLGSIALFVFILLGMINSFHGKMWEMPILGQYAKKVEL